MVGGTSLDIEDRGALQLCAIETVGVVEEMLQLLQQLIKNDEVSERKIVQTAASSERGGNAS